MPDEFDALETILEDQGTTIEAVANPRYEVMDVEDYAGTEEAINLLNAVYTGQIKHIAIKIDPDVDGYTSAAMFVSLFQKFRALHPVRTITVEYVMATGKQHGFIKDEFDEQLGEGWRERIDLVIIPDAGSDADSLKTAKELDDYGIWTLIVDHHPPQMIANPGYYTILVNPYLEDNNKQNTCFTGAGMTYRLISTAIQMGLWDIDPMNEPMVRYLEELCALGQVADVSDLRNEEVRRLVLNGIAAIKADMEQESEHNFIAELFRANEYAIKHGPTIKSLGWYIAPPMNAVIRVGTKEEKRDMFEALVWLQDDDRTVWYTPPKSKDPTRTPIEVTIQKDMARRCRNAKSRQDKTVRQLTKEYFASIPTDTLNHDSVIAIVSEETEEKHKPLTGLIANKLTDQVHRPVLLLSKYDNVYSGSGRGYEASGIGDFKLALKTAADDTGVIPETLAGHPNAFGFAVHENDLPKVIQSFTQEHPFDITHQWIPVAYEIKAEDLTNALVERIGKRYAWWGNHVNEPVIAVVDVRVNSENIKSYSEGQTIVFSSGGVKYVKKYCGQNEYDRLTRGDFMYGIGTPKRELSLTVIGTFEYDKDEAYVRVSHWESEVMEDGENGY